MHLQDGLGFTLRILASKPTRAVFCSADRALSRGGSVVQARWCIGVPQCNPRGAPLGGCPRAGTGPVVRSLLVSSHVAGNQGRPLLATALGALQLL